MIIVLKFYISAYNFFIFDLKVQKLHKTVENISIYKRIQQICCENYGSQDRWRKHLNPYTSKSLVLPKMQCKPKNFVTIQWTISFSYLYYPKKRKNIERVDVEAYYEVSTARTFNTTRWKKNLGRVHKGKIN